MIDSAYIQELEEFKGKGYPDLIYIGKLQSRIRAFKAYSTDIQKNVLIITLMVVMDKFNERNVNTWIKKGIKYIQVLLKENDVKCHFTTPFEHELLFESHTTSQVPEDYDIYNKKLGLVKRYDKERNIKLPFSFLRRRKQFLYSIEFICNEEFPKLKIGAICKVSVTFALDKE